MLSLNQIFSERAELVPLAQKQLKRSREWAINVCGETCHVNYVTLNLVTQTYMTPVVLLPGWGSGWEGISPLAFSLACEGHSVILVSLPGYGSSENPPKEYFGKWFLFHAACVVFGLLEKLKIQKAHVVGHSMGAQIAAKMAEVDSKRIDRLVLLSPGGVTRYSFFGGLIMAKRFISSGIRLHLNHRKMTRELDEEDYLQPLIDLCGKQKSPFGGWQRLKQRWAEFQATRKGGLVETLSKSNIHMVFYISGMLDTVFPPEENGIAILKAIIYLVDLQVYDGSILNDIPHNPTLFHSEITAAAISHYLEGK